MGRHADAATLAGLGAGAVLPSESTIRRTLQSLDADALDNLLGTWAQARTKPSPAQRRRISVDGKTLRLRHEVARGEWLRWGRFDVMSKT